MSGAACGMLLLFLAVLLALAYPLAALLARIADPTPIGGMSGRLERAIYRLAGVDPAVEMPWTLYAGAVLLFNAAGVIAVYALQRLQGGLPLNPAGLRRRLAGFGVQHRDQLRDQHQLAGLCAASRR